MAAGGTIIKDIRQKFIKKKTKQLDVRLVAAGGGMEAKAATLFGNLDQVQQP